MTETEKLLERLKALSELDLKEVLDGLNEHCYRYGMSHLPEGMGDSDSLNEYISELESQKEVLTGKVSELEDAVDEKETALARLIKARDEYSDAIESAKEVLSK